MIDMKRALLYGILAAVTYMLWMAWQTEHKIIPVSTSVPSVMIQQKAAGDLTVTPIHSTDPDVAAPETATETTTMASVTTDVLKVGFNTQTGDLVDARLLDYPETINDPEPFILLNNQPATHYITHTQLLVEENNVLKNVKVQFSPDSFRVDQDEKNQQWQVSLVGNAPGIMVKKTFVLQKGSYLIDVRYDVTNKGANTQPLSWTTQISKNNPVEDQSSLFHLGSYSGGAVSIPGDKLYKKISYADMVETPFEQSVKDGWVAMQQHYFLTAWIPPVGSMNKFYTQVAGTTYIMGILGEVTHIKPQETYSFSSRLYVGPELTDVLKAIAPGLDLTIDYGILSFISVFLFWILQGLYDFLGNWGWSIIFVTLLIKLAFFHLSAKSYRSMANMRKLQPKLEAIRQRFADDKTKLSQATMELYKKEKVNPLGGCLPIIVQIPVFIGLYWVLLESVQLRQAHFIFWIHDLSVADPYYVLPIIMGITMFVQQKLNPPPPDPTQAKIMLFLPVIFTGLFLNFPAGLVLYWTVNNTLSILQQWYITRKIIG